MDQRVSSGPAAHFHPWTYWYSLEAQVRAFDLRPPSLPQTHPTSAHCKSDLFLCLLLSLHM